MDKLLPLLGLCKRAGQLSEGCDAVREAILAHRSHLVLFGCDASKQTSGKLRELCRKQGIAAVSLSVSMQQLGYALGRASVGFVSINQQGFANKAAALINQNGGNE